MAMADRTECSQSTETQRQCSRLSVEEDEADQWWLMAMICGDPETRHVE